MPEDAWRGAPECSGRIRTGAMAESAPIHGKGPFGATQVSRGRASTGASGADALRPQADSSGRTGTEKINQRTSFPGDDTPPCRYPVTKNGGTAKGKTSGGLLILGDESLNNLNNLLLLAARQV